MIGHLFGEDPFASFNDCPFCYVNFYVKKLFSPRIYSCLWIVLNKDDEERVVQQKIGLRKGGVYETIHSKDWTSCSRWYHSRIRDGMIFVYKCYSVRRGWGYCHIIESLVSSCSKCL